MGKLLKKGFAINSLESINNLVHPALELAVDDDYKGQFGADVKITKKGKSASQTRICPSFWPVWCRLVSSKSCKKVVVVSPFYFILCCLLPSGTTYCVLLVQWLHCGDFRDQP